MRYDKESKGTICSFVNSVNIDCMFTHCRLCAGAPFAAKLSGMSATQNKGSEALGRTLRSSALCCRIPATEFPSGGRPGDLGLAPFFMSVQAKHDKTDIFSLSATISMVFWFF